MRWEELTEEQFEHAIYKSGGLCILPISAIEKNGQHLPVGATGLIMESIIEEALKLEDVMVFSSTVWLGEPACYATNAPDEPTNFRGTIQISQDLQLTIFKELCEEIVRNGFTKILVVSNLDEDTTIIGHSIDNMGYNPVNYAIMSLPAVNKKLSSAENVLKTVLERRADFPMITDQDIKTLEKWAKTGYGENHATFADTALVMAKYPELVAENRYDAEKTEPAFKSAITDIGDVFPANINSLKYPNGKMGFAPHGCTKSIGEAILKINAEHMAHVFKELKNDKDSLRLVNGFPRIQ